MRGAFQLVRDGMSIRRADRIKGFKCPTLLPYVRRSNIYCVKMGKLKFRPNYDCRNIYFLEQEKVLVEHLLN